MQKRFARTTRCDVGGLLIRHRGFTLIELVIVMAVMGMLISFVTLSIDPGGGNRTAEREARRLQLLLNAAYQESLLTGVPWRAHIDVIGRGYSFQKRSADNIGLAGRWTEEHGIRTLRQRELPPSIGFEIAGNRTTTDYYIVIDPLANIEFSPNRFVGSNRAFRVEVDALGRVSWSTESEEIL
ncbi:prepilin-type N-terminal cleavage/methylation domain-containing protein [Gammaproteobacteria bacterium]|nr:prepilin-type N-terminal cleavage/methylation domain-containing protein [Gammaproteobacteria bacterium]